jgi:hypothetical protein
MGEYLLATLIDHSQLWRGSGSMDEMPISGYITRASESLGQGEDLGICILTYTSGDYAALSGADFQSTTEDISVLNQKEKALL